MASSLGSRLVSPQKLERDRALEEFARDLPTLATQISAELPFLADELSPEALIGTLNAWRVLVDSGAAEAEANSAQLEEKASALLSHSESRVRSAAAHLLGALCRRHGPAVYARVQPRLFALVAENVERGLAEPEELSAKVSGSDGVFHDTAGWNALETSLDCLLGLAKAAGKNFRPFVTTELLSLLEQCLAHRNRFVRESCFGLVAQLVSCGAELERLLDWTAAGLKDNWSQVRMAASVAARALVQETGLRLPTEQLDQLLPPMCLNRFYLAQGVQIYSQETWRRAREGKEGLVVEHLAAIAKFYAAQTAADNHAVREAACHAIAELGAKVPKEQLQPFAEMLVTALVKAFGDDSWPVRDAACIATAKFLSAFPSIGMDSGPLSLRDVIMPKFWMQLTDCIPSVRQGAAESIAEVAGAYRDLDREIPDLVLSWLARDIGAVSAEGRLSPGPGAFGVVADAAHTDKTMFSCGSLAPKMRAAGCMDSAFRRPPQPWETTDACARLLAQLPTALPQDKGALSAFIPTLVEASQADHYVAHVKLKETLCQQLPLLCKGLGKTAFKAHVQQLLGQLLQPSLASDCCLTSVAAEESVKALAALLGPSILRGRIQMLDKPQPLLDHYNRLCPPLPKLTASP